MNKGAVAVRLPTDLRRPVVDSLKRGPPTGRNLVCSVPAIEFAIDENRVRRDLRKRQEI
jgi:hypothetical protein